MGVWMYTNVYIDESETSRTAWTSLISRRPEPREGWRPSRGGRASRSALALTVGVAAGTDGVCSRGVPGQGTPRSTTPRTTVLGVVLGVGPRPRPLASASVLLLV